MRRARLASEAKAELVPREAELRNSSNNFVAMAFPSLPKKLLTRSFSTPGWDVGERPSRSMPYFKLPEHEGLEVAAAAAGS